MPGTHAPARIRFWRHVRVDPHGCWEWTANRLKEGYGQFKADGRPVRAHRYSWQLHFGRIPAGLLVCHHCDNPPCIRPDHLFLGTCAHNTADMVRKGRAPKPDQNDRAIAAIRRLSDDEIRYARRCAADGDSYRSIGRRLDVAHTTVMRAVNGTHWKAVDLRS